LNGKAAIALEGPPVEQGSGRPRPIPLSIPDLGGNEWSYIKDCLDTGWVSSAGPFVERFEREIARYTGAPHAVACASGTAALHVALLLAGVGPEDEVIVPTLTFVATINAVRYTGAYPVFMDCDDFYCIDAEKSLDFLAQETVAGQGGVRNKRTGRRIAALMPVHVFGNAAALEVLVSACRERGIPVIEDAAESLGTAYTTGAFTGKHTGAIGELGCLSFNGNKIVTTGGGGMILTAGAALAARAKYLTTQAKDDDLRFIHNEVGYNYRLTNLQAALGVAQLEQLPRFLETKAAHYAQYADGLRNVRGLTLAPVPAYACNNHWLCSLRVNAEIYGCDRDALMRRLTARGIQSRPVWGLNHLQRPFAHCQAYRIERATELWQTTLSLPSSAGLKPEDIQSVIEALHPTP
jgi:perosamine synthetase